MTYPTTAGDWGTLGAGLVVPADLSSITPLDIGEFFASRASTRASATANAGADTGLGGSRLWVPPGNVDLLVKLSSTVPDNPTVDDSDEQLSHTGVTGSVSLVNRYWLTVS